MKEEDAIRDQMENTRSALSEKLEILEDRVTTTVQDATDEVADTVASVTDTVQETVETVKETIEDTLSTVKEGVGAIKNLFDVPRHVDNYPWAVVGGSVALGFVLGKYLSRSNRPAPRSGFQETAAGTRPSHNGQPASANEQPKEKPKGVLDLLAPELDRLKGLALGALMGTVREMIVETANDNIAQPLSEIIDSVTEKIGGKPVPHIHHEEQSRSAAPSEMERFEGCQA